MLVLQAPVLLTQQHVQDRVKLNTQAKVVMADAEWQQISQHPTTSPGVPADPKRLMYMIFTSGEQFPAVSQMLLAAFKHWICFLSAHQELSEVMLAWLLVRFERVS